MAIPSRRFCALSLAAGFMVLLAFPHRATGQSTANLLGTVTDSSNAAIPGATITMHNIATGDVRTVKTDSSGNYQAPSLQPGQYIVEASASGFQTQRAKGVVLNVSTTISMNFSLGVAAAQQVINVTAQTPVVNPTGITVGQVVDRKTVQQAPLNGRHFVDLGA